MFKCVAITLFAILAGTYAKPSGLLAAPFAAPFAAPLAYAAPGIVTAASTQVVARNYNGFAAPYVAGPFAYAAGPATIASPLSYSAAYTTPFSYSAPYARYASGYAAAPLGYPAASPYLW